jgi:hypothetical protein
LEASPKPKAKSKSGISATFGIGISAAISGSKKMRTGRNIAINSPIATAGTAPMTKPANTRHSVAAVCIASSPLSVSCQNRTAMSLGAGTKRRSPKPARSRISHTTRSPIGEIR